MSDRKLTRRNILGSALCAALGLPSLVSRSDAADNRISSDDPKAKNLGYVENAKQVDTKRFPSYKDGQTCTNCTLVQQHYGFWRPCQLFPGKSVNAKGWCSAWTNKAATG